MSKLYQVFPKLGAVLLTLPLLGCALVGDALDPTFVAQLGLDPATIISQPGVVLVAFNNTTNQPAVFQAFSTVDAIDPTRGARNFSVDVAGKEVKNEVVDCPVGLIAPGSLDASFAWQRVGATVTTGTATTAVEYGGVPVTAGQSFLCGDVIEIRLSAAAATGDQQNYLITVRVIPGR